MFSTKDLAVRFAAALSLIVIILSSCIFLKAASMKNAAECTADANVSTITVTGCAETEKMPDIIRLTVSVSQTADTSREAQNRANAMMRKIISIATDEFSVNDDDIYTKHISISPSYSWEDGKQVLLGQKAVQNVTITVREPDSVPALIDALVSVDGISISDAEGDLLDRNFQLSVARDLAVSDARRKAKDYATALGATLGEAVKVTDTSSSYPVTAKSSARVMVLSNDSYAGYSETRYFSDPVVSSASVEVVFRLEY